MSDQLDVTAQTYHDALLETRFKEPPPKEDVVLSEKAVDYIYRAIDRQINKARGALAYNGLLFASFGLVARNTKDSFILAVACLGAIFALASCFPLLYLMIFDVGSSADYKTTQSDFTAAFTAMWNRRGRLEFSLWLSLAASVFAIILPVYYLVELLLGKTTQ